MRKLKDLRVEEFPWADPVKFEAWRKAAVRHEGTVRYLPYILLAGLCITVPLVGGFFGWALPVIGTALYFCSFLGPRRFKIEKMREELGISAEALADILKTE